MRLPLQDVYKIGGIGTVPVGRVESGKIYKDQNIVFAPINIVTTVNCLESFHNTMLSASVGDNIGWYL